MQIHALIHQSFNVHREALLAVEQQLSSPIQEACLLIASTLNEGNKLLLAGNGGSAADAQHIAAEFTGRFVKERAGLAAIALTTDTSALTAIGNDYGYQEVFARQVQALGSTGDLLIAISTSGNSESILRAAIAAKKKDVKILALTGNDGGKLKDLADLALIVPHEVTARIQEMHILIGHIFCEYIDSLH